MPQGAPSIEVRVLGPIEVIADGRPVDLGGTVGPALVAILAFEPGPHQKIDLVTRLKGDGVLANEATTKSALDSLYTLVSKVKAAGNGALRNHIVGNRGARTYRLERSAAISIDYDLFLADIESGRIEDAARRIDGVEPCQGTNVPYLTGYRSLVTTKLDKARARYRGVERIEDSLRPTESGSIATARCSPRELYLGRQASGQLDAEAFIDRQTTSKAITDIGSDPDVPVTIFVGAGGSLDTGRPDHQLLIENLVKKASDSQDAGLSHQTRERLIRVLHQEFGPRYLGSVYRELEERNEYSEDQIASRIREVLNQPAPDGQRAANTSSLILSIWALASAFATSRRQVRVITTNYDKALLKPDGPVRFESAASHEEESSPTRVPVYFLNGYCDGAPYPAHVVIGELAFFVGRQNRSAGGDVVPSSHHATRQAALDFALEHTKVLIIGSSLTDPDVIAALARHRDKGQDRYAVFVSPEREDTKIELDGDVSAVSYRLTNPDNTPITKIADRLLVRELVTARYLHLGVYPLIADYRHQVPLFLRHIAAHVSDNGNYASRCEFLRTWWNGGAAAFFGYDRGGSQPDYHASDQVVQDQEEWRGKLDVLRAELESSLRLDRSNQRLEVELWLRNPKARVLFRWGSSCAVVKDGASVAAVSWADMVSTEAQEQLFAYWKGHPVHGRTNKHADRGSHYSIFLTLDNLQLTPVGVLSVLGINMSDASPSILAGRAGALNRAKIRPVINAFWEATSRELVAISPAAEAAAQAWQPANQQGCDPS